MPGVVITATDKCQAGHEVVVTNSDEGVKKILAGSGTFQTNVDTGETTELYCSWCAIKAHEIARYHGWEK